MFFKAFKEAFDATFIEEKIQNAFAKPGIWPVYRDDIIATIRLTKLTPLVSDSPIRTPKNPLQVRNIHKKLRNNPQFKEIEKLFKGLEIATTRADIAEHENHGLREAIILEQKKRKRSKKLDLAGEPDAGTIYYSLAKIVRVRAYQEAKEAELQAVKETKIAQKAKQEANRSLRIQNQEARQAERQLQKEMRIQNTPQPKTATKKQPSIAPTPKLAAPRLVRSKKALIKSSTIPSPRKKAILKDIQPEVVSKRVVRTTRGGRAITLLQRF